jgi:flagellar motor protein MotB
MNNKLPLLGAAFLFFILGAARPLPICLADSSDDYDENGVKKTYYWQGTQLNNLSRLGSTSDFEEEQRRAGEGKDTEEYLAKIRAQMAHQSQIDAQKKATLTYQGQLPDNPIDVTYLSPGVRVTLHAEALFDENSATMKMGAIDTLARLRTVLETEQQQPLQLVIADKMDDIPEARNLDAERSLVVLSMLAMTEKDAAQENLTPEILTR